MGIIRNFGPSKTRGYQYPSYKNNTSTYDGVEASTRKSQASFQII